MATRNTVGTRRKASRQVDPVAAPEVRLVISNRQRDRRVDARALRCLVQQVQAEAGQAAELGLHLVSARRSAELNQQFLGHEGPTDIITFDQGSTWDRVCGELFICVAEAIRQAREFGTTWDREVRRYVIHGLLHLRGFDDLEPGARRLMKREENRLVKRFG
ncbi:MAG: rRNA maturation RNase YbeY [Verrucomicrobia bacterium]|nr:rRNA maturation RNase YbeY [Verrucomicrobiota bacterium]